MGSLPPTLLVDNRHDRVFMYPAGVLDASGSQADREPWRTVSARRERQYWQPPTDAEHWLRMTVGAGNESEADYIWMDRGHNRWGTSVHQEFGSDGANWLLTKSWTIPALVSGRIPVGGDPFGPSGCVTEEGAWYAFYAKTGPWLWDRTRFPALGGGTITTIPGLMVGLRHTFLGYSGIFDPDAGERTQLTARSRTGYRAVDTTYSWRVLKLRFAHIPRAEYFGRIRRLMELLFKRNQPCYALPNAGLYPTLGGLFQYEGTSFSAPTQRVHHSLEFTLTEVGARVD